VLGFAMLSKISIILLSVTASTAEASTQSIVASLATEELIEYSKFDHSVVIDDLRSGNHDEDGTNEYQFKFLLKVYKKPPTIIDPRKKKAKVEIKVFKDIDLGEIPKIEIPVLTRWKPSASQKEQFTLDFSGDSLRQEVAQFMNTEGVKESEVRARMKITLLEKGLIPYFHEDTLLSSFTYEVYDVVEDLQKNKPISFEISPETGGGYFSIKILPKPNEQER